MRLRFPNWTRFRSGWPAHTRPARFRASSSDRVGCGRSVRISSASVVSSVLRDRVALDQFGHFGADHVRPEQFAPSGVDTRFLPSPPLAQGDTLPLPINGRCPTRISYPASRAAFSVNHDARHLRPAIGAGRDVARIERITSLTPAIFSTQITPSWLALCARTGRRHRRSRKCRPPVRAVHRRRCDSARSDPGAFEADALNIADHAAHDHALGGHVERFSPSFDMRGNPVAAAIETLHRRAGLDRDPLLFEAPPGESRISSSSTGDTRSALQRP